MVENVKNVGMVWPKG